MRNAAGDPRDVVEDDEPSGAHAQSETAQARTGTDESHTTDLARLRPGQSSPESQHSRPADRSITQRGTEAGGRE